MVSIPHRYGTTPNNISASAQEDKCQFLIGMVQHVE